MARKKKKKFKPDITAIGKNLATLPFYSVSSFLLRNLILLLVAISFTAIFAFIFIKVGTEYLAQILPRLIGNTFQAIIDMVLSYLGL